jgi:hypothetical protein
MPRKDYCPICESPLKATKTTKMVCTTIGCPFKDRRTGIAVVDPLIDRREGLNRFAATMHKDPWANERNWK